MKSWWQKYRCIKKVHNKRPRILSFRSLIMKFSKTVFYEVNIVSQCLHLEVLLQSKSASEKRGFKLMQILGLLGMYFDASEVFVINFSLLFRLALGILCCICSNISPGPFLLCTFIIHETFWPKRKNIFSHPFHILRAYFLRSWFLNFFPTLLKSCIDYVWFQLGRHFYHTMYLKLEDQMVTAN